jgi:triosephosphate isomerase
MKCVLSSWKMYPTVVDTQRLSGAVQLGLRERVDSGRAVARVIICPPFLSLVQLRKIASDEIVALGAHNYGAPQVKKTRRPPC